MYWNLNLQNTLNKEPRKAHGLGGENLKKFLFVSVLGANQCKPGV